MSRLQLPATRVIPRLDIKSAANPNADHSIRDGAGVRRHNLVKGIRLEGFRVIGDPADYALNYYEAGADELLYIDAVASLYGRNSLIELVERTAETLYVPLTVGGGIRTVEDIHQLLRAGADKVAINTAAIENPELITKSAQVFGSQCIVLSVQAKRQAPGGWEAYTHNGREQTGMDAIQWAKKAVELGAGEVLLTSVDQEGTQNGFDLDLIGQLGADLPVPLIASGGAGSSLHAVRAVEAGADAVAIASLLHYEQSTLEQIKKGMAGSGLELRL